MRTVRTIGFEMMKCPRCVQRIHRAAESCPHCGFSLEQADERFGGEDVRLRRLTDRAGILRSDERERVELAMTRIERKFPQVFVAIHTGALGEVANIRQFGFWLLNHAAFEDLPPDKPNQGGILITVDPESKAAGIFFGYLLDPYLDETDTFECLSRAHAYWLEQRYAEGLIRALLHLESLLCRRSRQARRDPGQFRRKVMPPAMGDAMRRIRDGHRIKAAAKPTKEVGK
jgi:hypothetical protein